jgi:hypothetical protein
VNVEQWVEESLEVHERQAKGEVRVTCPFCQKPKFWVNVKRGKGLCFRGCFEGKIEYLVARLHNIPVGKAKGILEAGGTMVSLEDMLDKIGTHVEDTDADVRIPLPKGYQFCWTPEGMQVPQYAEDPMPRGRGLSDATLRRHGIGFVEEGRLRDHLVIPIMCKGKRTFQARVMGDPRDFSWTTREGKVITPPKWWTPPDSKIGTFLYWWDNTPRKTDVIIVEGLFDAVRLITLGFHALCNFGKKLTRAQLNLICELDPKTVVFMYDGTATQEALRDARKLLGAGSRAAVKIATLPEEDDPDSFGYRKGRKGVRKILRAADDVGDGLGDMHFAISRIERRKSRQFA